jgi:hypothetical protein
MEFSTLTGLDRIRDLCADAVIPSTQLALDRDPEPFPEHDLRQGA